MAHKPETRLQRGIHQAVIREFGGWLFKVHGGMWQDAGVPDLVGTIGGFFVAIEVKMPGTGKVSKIQELTMSRIRAQGSIAIVADSPNSAVQQLSDQLTIKMLRRNQVGRTWHNMKSRCYNKKAPNYERYGGRGVRVCDRWLKGVLYFYLDMGFPPYEEDEEGYEVRYSIDRIDPTGNYEPGNCRWLKLSENSGRHG